MIRKKKEDEKEDADYLEIQGRVINAFKHSIKGKLTQELATDLKKVANGDKPLNYIVAASVAKEDTLAEYIAKKATSGFTPFFLGILDKVIGRSISSEKEFNTLIDGLAASSLLFLRDSKQLPKVVELYKKYPVLIVCRIAELMNFSGGK